MIPPVETTDCPGEAIQPIGLGTCSSVSPWGKADAAPEVTRVLRGPQRRAVEVARAVRIFVELMRGFRALHLIHLAPGPTGCSASRC